MNVEQLTQEVYRRLQEHKPRVLVIGESTELAPGYDRVYHKLYDMVLIGGISAAGLLHMPSEEVCRALLDGKPVFYSPAQSWKGNIQARPLCRALQAAEQRLLSLGVQMWKPAGRLVTAEAARAMLLLGQTPPPGCPVTPLARDILEGKA